ncbi:MAG: hypothetical protein ACREYF_20175 [Gammaproteobacteria bacterium]
MFAILGSGFGLYGYLPALVDGCAQRIVLPERYRARFSERSELARFAGDVQWEADEDSVLGCVEGIVLALRPANQSEWVPRCLARANIGRLLLEKPLAQSPDAATAIFQDLLRSRKLFRLGYSLRYTAWGERILNAASIARGSGVLSIRWKFLAHHFQQELVNWKRFHATGGGAIRFYGIHIIALLAEIGYRHVTLSRAFGTSLDEVDEWVAAFAGAGLPECEVLVNTRSAVRAFSVHHASASKLAPTRTVFADLSDPFDLEPEACESGSVDRRVRILSRLCRSLWEEDADQYEWYDASIRLWSSVEEHTRFEVRTAARRSLVD